MKREDFLDENGVVQPIETHDSILGFFGKYHCFSNFHAHPVTFEGITYMCSEGAYMAQKTTDLALRREFAPLTGSEAKKKGKTIQLRDGWDEIHRLHAMYRVLLAKFSQDTESLSILVGTGNKYLEETNWWNDQYWGKSFGKGTNHLGQILMTIRGFVSPT